MFFDQRYKCWNHAFLELSLITFYFARQNHTTFNLNCCEDHTGFESIEFFDSRPPSPGFSNRAQIIYISLSKYKLIVKKSQGFLFWVVFLALVRSSWSSFVSLWDAAADRAEKKLCFLTFVCKKSNTTQDRIFWALRDLKHLLWVRGWGLHPTHRVICICM